MLSVGSWWKKSRVIVGSGHDAVVQQVRWPRRDKPSKPSRTGRRQVVNLSHRLEEVVTSRTTLETIQQVCREITTRYKAPKGFVESDELKRLRRTAKGLPVAEARRVWIQIWKHHQRERKNFEEDRRQKALAKDWAALEGIEAYELAILEYPCAAFYATSLKRRERQRLRQRQKVRIVRRSLLARHWLRPRLRLALLRQKQGRRLCAGLRCSDIYSLISLALLHRLPQCANRSSRQLAGAVPSAV